MVQTVGTDQLRALPRLRTSRILAPKSAEAKDDQQTVEQVRNAWRAALRPPREVSYSQWVEENVRLTKADGTPWPGPFRFRNSPYARAPLDAAGDPRTTDLVIMAGTQGLKSETGLNVVSAMLAQDPGPVMWAMDSERQAKKVSKQRIQGRLDRIEVLHAKRMHGAKFWTIDEMFFLDSVVRIAGANSPGQRRSWPAKLLVLDEIDAYRGATEQYADVISDFESRTKAFGDLATRMYISSPTTREGPIYHYWLQGTQEEWHVPCPRCGTYQILAFAHIKWKSRHPKEARKEAWYECPHCNKRIEDHDKPDMNTAGEWRARFPERGPEIRSFRWPSFYANQLSWGYFAEEYLKCFPKDSAGFVIRGSRPHPDKLQGTVNNDWAEIFESPGDSASPAQILSRRGLGRCEFPPSIVPIDSPLALILTADQQQDHYPYELAAYGPHETCYTIQYGRVDSLGALEALAQTQWPGRRAGQFYGVTHKAIDSGGQHTDRIYEFCRRHAWYAIKGEHRSLKPQLVKTVFLQDQHVTMIEVVSHHFKDALLLKLRINLEDPGSWHLHNLAEQDYADELTAQHAVTIWDRFLRPQRVWTKKREDLADDWLLCRVYNMAVAMMLQIRDPPREMPGEGGDPESLINPVARAFAERLRSVRAARASRFRRKPGRRR